MRFVKYLVVAVSMTLILALAGRLVLQKVKPSYSYGIRAEFRELPSDDRELEQWLGSHSGVVKVAIGRDDKAIRVYWIMSQNLLGSPPTPDIRSEFERLGYRGLVDFNGNWVDK